MCPSGSSTHCCATKLVPALEAQHTLLRHNTGACPSGGSTHCCTATLGPGHCAQAIMRMLPSALSPCAGVPRVARLPARALGHHGAPQPAALHLGAGKLSGVGQHVAVGMSASCQGAACQWMAAAAAMRPRWVGCAAECAGGQLLCWHAHLVTALAGECGLLFLRLQGGCTDRRVSASSKH